MRHWISAAALFAALAGCVSSSHIIVGKVYERVWWLTVKVYLRPPAQYEEVAIIEASSRGSFSFTDQGMTDAVIDGLKAEAAELGADGVLLTGYGDSPAGAVGTANRTGPGSAVGISSTLFNKVGQAIAIKVIKE